MRLLFDEFSRTIIAVITCSIMISIFMFILISLVYPSSVKAIEINVNDNKTVDDKLPVSIEQFVIKDAVVGEGEVFNYQDKIQATNNRNEDISSYVTLLNTVDTSKAGEKKAQYILRYNGQTMVGEGKVIVEEKEVVNEEYD